MGMFLLGAACGMTTLVCLAMLFGTWFAKKFPNTVRAVNALAEDMMEHGPEEGEECECRCHYQCEECDCEEDVEEQNEEAGTPTSAAG